MSDTEINSDTSLAMFERALDAAIQRLCARGFTVSYRAEIGNACWQASVEVPPVPQVLKG
jgi:hypothetical protein